MKVARTMNRRISMSIRWLALIPFACLGFQAGCGGIFNPAFTNTFFGGQFPLTPGPAASAVMVRVLNETTLNAEFIVTIEKAVIQRDDAGNPIVDENNDVHLRPVRQTVRLSTLTVQPANELGVLFSCLEEPINIIGLGETLQPNDIAVFVGGTGAGGTGGFGIPAATINPLVRQEGNFACGDTVIFRAIEAPGVTGGVVIESFLLPGFEQPESFEGPSTFLNWEEFIQSQTREDD